MKKFLKDYEGNYTNIESIIEFKTVYRRLGLFDIQAVLKENYGFSIISQHKSELEAKLALIDLIAWIEEDKSRWEENNQ